MAIDSRDNQGRDRAISEKIVGQMRSIGKAPPKQFTGEELQKLQSAASRLDQMLKDAEEADQQVLKSAAERLDRLLTDMRAGKDVSRIFKRREK
jgi:cell division septum initiation protein DivIVA